MSVKDKIRSCRAIRSRNYIAEVYSKSERVISYPSHSQMSDVEMPFEPSVS